MGKKSAKKLNRDAETVLLTVQRWQRGELLIAVNEGKNEVHLFAQSETTTSVAVLPQRLTRMLALSMLMADPGFKWLDMTMPEHAGSLDFWRTSVPSHIADSFERLSPEEYDAKLGRYPLPYSPEFVTAV